MNKRLLFGISLVIATLDLLVLLTQNTVFRSALISNGYELTTTEMMKTIATTAIGIIAALLILLLMGLVSGMIVIKKITKDEEDE